MYISMISVGSIIQKGGRVVVTYPGSDGVEYPGVVSGMHKTGSVEVTYDDETKEMTVRTVKRSKK